ncbi:F0F1 ATP synthase subunit A [Tunturiibacter gelidoferens]|uniref:ATP synthase subunit a n=2 Tax=Tunturiibacter TaxID=3154218 RepID=A0A7Y9T2B5_9BACT|nr:F0F1 ATP synthase subunit A [Edaphobacter lichenicola]MBB5339276.1 F-type H+-transporting ATPase subunit a [Edaphobacter lichenicola]NYF51463.1 F-type H+-transporting ATPase subunit a [Edaphobacter lichenicola]
MPTQTAITLFLNQHFGAFTTSFLEALHVHPKYPAYPISDSFAMELLVFFVLIAYFMLVRMTLSVEKPAAAQHLAEMTHEFVSEQGEQIIGHGSERFTSYLTALGLFILLANLMGVVPGLKSPTAYAVVPLGFALCTFIYYHYHGVRENGWAYIKQFLGPVWWLYPLLLPIEIISHFARVLSLTVRLYANMFAGDLVTIAFFSLVPVGIPLIFLGLHVGVAVVQAYVFFLLASIYLSLAVAHDH